VNKVWLDYSGKEMGDQLGMNWIKNVHPEDIEKLMTEYQYALEAQLSLSAEFRLKNRNNEYEWMLMNGRPRFGHGNLFMGFIGSCLNINHQKESERKISKINAELIESNSTKDKFFSIISHDLRGPLGGLMGILEILATSNSSLEDSEKQEIISEAQISSKNTYTLLENLLEWSRIKTGTIPYQPEKMNLLSLINNVIPLYNQNINEKDINLNVNVKTDISIIADRRMTETVLRNLISNAIKFTHRRGRIVISTETHDTYISINVRDSGVGMDESKLEKLFRTEEHCSTKGTEKESGTGLGLILCKELVEKQGGKIGVESIKDKGSNFYFTVLKEN
jgi:signal transduction histidine kinase